MRFLHCLIATMAAASAVANELVVSESLEIAKVPADFPVGFDLLTTTDRQYVAYYDADRHMTVAARSLNSSQWVYQKLPSQIICDSHNYVTIDPSIAQAHRNHQHINQC